MLTGARQYFGWVETVGGFLKVCLILGVSLVLCVIAGKGAVSPKVVLRHLL